MLPGQYLTIVVGLNVRMALENTTLSTGGGKAGKEPVAVPKDTTISE